MSEQEYNEILASNASLKKMYQEQKIRADLLQAEIDKIDELHFDECMNIYAENAYLKRQLRMKEVN